MQRSHRGIAPSGFIFSDQGLFPKKITFSQGGDGDFAAKPAFAADRNLNRPVEDHVHTVTNLGFLDYGLFHLVLLYAVFRGIEDAVQLRIGEGIKDGDLPEKVDVHHLVCHEIESSCENAIPYYSKPWENTFIL